MGGKSSTTTQSVSIPPEVLARYNSVNARAESVAQQPFQRYGGEFVAGLTQQQQAGMANTNAAANQAQPYYAAASNTQNAAYQQGMGQTQQAYQPLAQGQQQGQYHAGRADQGYNAALTSAAPYYQQASQDVTRGLGGVQGYNAAATESAMAAPGMARGMNEYAQNQILSAQGRAQPANAAAMRQAAGAQAMAEPYYDAATRGTMGATQAASPYQDAATLSALEGGQSVSPGELQTAQYMNPYTKSVADSTYQALRQQQQQEMAGQTGNAIRSGAFGGDRAGLAAAALSRQQNLATAQAMSPIYERGYQQALQTAQQQQGVNLSAEQANRAARQQQAQQLLGIGQQGYAQRMGEAQQAAALGEKRYGMNNQTAALLSQLGQSQYQQALGAGQAALGAGQQFYGQGAQQAQLMSGLGGTAYQQQLAAAQQRQAIGQAQQGLYNQYGQAQQGLGQQQFAQGATTAQQQAALARQGYDIGAQTAQQQAALGTGAQNAALQGAQAQIAAGTLEQQTRQADLTANYQQFLQERGYPFQVAQFLANIAMGTGALSGSTTTTTQPSSFFSDERLKENIHPVGETFDGQTIYRYNYKGEPGTQIGLIAQEVERHHPDAVGRAQGFKTVDYDRATEDAARAGLGAASMGGAVYEPGNYARGGYAPGGLVDPNDMQALLKQQAASFGPFGQVGLYGGKSGDNPMGGGSYVPKAGLHTPKLMTAGALPRNPDSRLKDTVNTIDQLEKTGQRYFGEKGILTKEGIGGKLAQKAGILSPDKKPSEASGVAAGAPAPTDTAKTANAGLAPPSAASSAPAASSGEQGWLDKAKGFVSGVGEAFGFEQGGVVPRLGYAGLGKVIDPMEIQDPSKGVGAYIEDATEDQTNAELAKPGQAPGQSRGAGSDIKDALGLASSAASLASAAPGAASAAGSGLSALMAMLPFVSDARLKDNIRPVGKTYDGQNIYAYDFGDGATRMGLMAQEVLNRKPEAVGQSRDGFLTLDYDRATEDAVPGLAPRERAYGGGVAPRMGYADGSDVAPVEAAGLVPVEEADLPALNAQEAEQRYKIQPQNLEDMPQHRQDFIRGIYGPESGGRYDIRNGGKETFDINGPHPGKTPGLGGTSSASGAPQMIYDTWQRITGGAPMTKGYQDAATWELGVQDYKRRTGRDLDADLQEEGFSPRIKAALAPTWVALGKSRGVAPQSGQLVQQGDQPAQGAQNASFSDQAKGVASGVKGFWDDNKGIIIPVLRGLGAMASSPSRYAGSAILQGLGAGAEAYADYEKQNADVGLTKAQTAETAQRATNLSFIGDMVRLPDGRMIYTVEAIKKGLLPAGANLSGATMDSAAKHFLTQAGYLDANGQFKIPGTSETGAKPPTGAGLDDADMPKIIDAKVDPAMTERGIFGKDSRRLAKDDIYLVKGPNKAANERISQNYAEAVSGARDAASGMQGLMGDLAINTSKIVNGQNISAAGATSDFRADMLNRAKTLGRALGIPEEYFANYDTLVKNQNKINTHLASRATSSAGQHNLGAFQMMMTAMATPDLPPDTQAKIAAQMWIENQRARDRGNHMNIYGEASGGSYARAGQAFDNDTRGRYEAEQKFIQHLIRNYPVEIEKMINGGKSPQIIEAFLQKMAQRDGIRYVPNVNRYFVFDGQ